MLVLCGDVPLISVTTLQRLVAECASGHVGVLTVRARRPYGLRAHPARRRRACVGHRRAKDANSDQLALKEINSGVICAPSTELRRWLNTLSADNAQGEYYLTDVVGAAVADGVPVYGVRTDDPDEVMGINDRRHLAAAERIVQRRAADELLAAGVTLADPARIDVRGVRAGEDTFIDVNCVFEGEVVLGQRVVVGPGSVIRNTRIGDDTVIHPHCVMDDSAIGARCQIGPFARLRPGATFEEGAKPATLSK